MITESSRHIDPLAYDQMALPEDQLPSLQATYSTILLARQSFLALFFSLVPGHRLLVLRTSSKTGLQVS
jgi:hypothetical protein